MDTKKEKPQKNSFFRLPQEDRIDFELEDKQKQEKDTAAEKVLNKLNDKYTNN
ncbi:hypothetical protein ACFOGI_04080 [Virgibacillus xinjiangensis]|uniref:YfhD-like protein n=1 Tax=Virgibacillus xinjiangensis TaxID=393090 RepID=A0ABV7CT11_9BACI